MNKRNPDQCGPCPKVPTRKPSRFTDAGSSRCRPFAPHRNQLLPSFAAVQRAGEREGRCTGCLASRTATWSGWMRTISASMLAAAVDLPCRTENMAMFEGPDRTRNILLVIGLAVVVYSPSCTQRTGCQEREGRSLQPPRQLQRAEITAVSVRKAVTEATRRSVEDGTSCPPCPGSLLNLT